MRNEFEGLQCLELEYAMLCIAVDLEISNKFFLLSDRCRSLIQKSTLQIYYFDSSEKNFSKRIISNKSLDKTLYETLVGE